MKNCNSSKKRIIVSLCLIVGVLTVFIGGTLAIYTSQDHQRSVVRNRDNEIIRFSSDKLYRVTGDAPVKAYYYPMSKESRTMEFQVCNYDQAKNTLYNEKQIGYEITFEVKNGSEGEYTISNGKTTQTVTNGNRVQFNDSLTGGRKSINTYSFVFHEGDFNKVELVVTVTPANLTVTQNRILNGKLIPVEYATTQGVTMQWEYTDSDRGRVNEFDAYNVLVSISGGARNVFIKWDSSQLDIDPFFAEGKTVTKNGNFSTITVPMNSEDITGTYLIQFYNHNSTKPGWTTWSDIPIEVTLGNEP